MRVGCHISIRNGYLAAAKTAKAIGADVFQYFPKNPRSLTLKTADAADCARCRVFCREHDIASIAHTAYPVNIAAGDPGLRRAMLQTLINDFDIAEACGSLGVVVHFGVYKGNDPLQGYRNSIQLLNELCSSRRMEARILLENQAGAGSMMGTSLEELTQVRELCREPESIGFCLDTCHLFASGVWNGRNWSELAERGDEIGFFRHLKAVHLNDSRYESGLRKDRHANIGSGRVGAAAIGELLRSPLLQSVPCVLETPAPAPGMHEEEIRMIHSLARSGGETGD